MRLFILSTHVITFEYIYSPCPEKGLKMLKQDRLGKIRLRD